MKTLRFFTVLPILALAATLTLSSCSKDEKGIENAQAPEGYGYFAIALNTQSATAVRASMTGVGTPEESFVDEALVVLYNSSSQVAYQFKPVLSNVSGGVLQNFAGGGLASAQPGGGSSARLLTHGQLVVEDDYEMLVILNPTTKMVTATAVGKDLTEFTTAKTGVTAAEFLGTNRMVMTNADGLVTVVLRSSVADAELNPTLVAVDRVVAKITTVKGADFDTHISSNKGDLYTNITDISWYVENLNTKTYWMRVPALGRGKASESSLSSRLDYYATDPNMDADEINYGTPTVDLSNTTALAGSKNPLENLAGADTEYVIENTFGTAADPIKDGTVVIVKCKIQPIGYSENDSYYSFDGLCFTHEEAMGWRYGSGTVPLSPSGLGTAVGNSEFFEVGAEQPGNYAEDEDNGIVFHYGGWNVYRIPIKHFGGAATTDWGYYGVVRNNAYQVNILDITGPGEPAVYNKFIAADVTINPWLIRDPQNETLGHN